MPKLEHPGQKSIALEVTSANDTTLVGRIPGKKIRVLSCFLIASGTVSVEFLSYPEDDTPTKLTGTHDLVAQSGYSLNYNPSGWFETLEGESLGLDLSGAVKVAGVLNYDIIS